MRPMRCGMRDDRNNRCSCVASCFLNPIPLARSYVLCAVCLSSPKSPKYSNGYCRLVIHPKLSKVSEQRVELALRAHPEQSSVAIKPFIFADR